MCGLWGYAGNIPAENRLLKNAAMLAARRGPDGWGITTAAGDRRGVGRLPAAEVHRLPPSRLVVGHCRLATVLGTKTPDAGQPIRAARFVVAHNGTVANAGDLVAGFGLVPATANDSEILALLLDAMPGSADERLAAALGRVDHGGHYALAVLDTVDMRVLLSARGLPLWRLVTPGGMYWCSIRPGMEWEPVGG